MNGTDVLVILGGIAAIAWVNWYFFVAGRGSAAEPVVDSVGVQEVLIRVDGGYEPSSVRVSRGIPVRLVFDRRESAACSEEVVLPEFGIRKFLPPQRKTAIEFTPDRDGSFEFTCGMSMLRGRLTVVSGGREEEG